jgi:hypothetical protein
LIAASSVVGRTTTAAPPFCSCFTRAANDSASVESYKKNTLYTCMHACIHTYIYTSCMCMCARAHARYVKYLMYFSCTRKKKPLF